MRPPGFFDLEDRFAKLDGLDDPLVKIAQVVDWEGFHSVLNRAFAKARKSNAGRKEYGRVLMFKILVLQQLYNLSDDQTEFRIRDRYSFGRFLGLNPEAVVPDAKTIWRFREGLKSGEVFDSLFSQLSLQIAEQGYVARKGQIVDASIVKAPRQRNTREDNAQEKGGEIPEDWSENKRRHKDVDARWTRKHGVTHYGYKNHISMDREFGCAGGRSPMGPVMTAGCSNKCSMRRIPMGMCGRTARIAAASMSGCWQREGGAVTFTARPIATGHFRLGPGRPTASVRRCAPPWSMSSLSTRPWAASGSGPSAWPERESRSG